MIYTLKYVLHTISNNWHIKIYGYNYTIATKLYHKDFGSIYSGCYIRGYESVTGFHMLLQRNKK